MSGIWPRVSSAALVAALRAAGAQTAVQLAAQLAAALHVERLVDRLVRHPHARIVAELGGNRQAICSGDHQASRSAITRAHNSGVAASLVAWGAGPARRLGDARRAADTHLGRRWLRLLARSSTLPAPAGDPTWRTNRLARAPSGPRRAPQRQPRRGRNPHPITAIHATHRGQHPTHRHLRTQHRRTDLSLRPPQRRQPIDPATQLSIKTRQPHHHNPLEQTARKSSLTHRALQ